MSADRSNSKERSGPKAPGFQGRVWGKIDRYISAKFLVTFFFIFCVLMAIAIVIDISEKMDDFLDPDFAASGSDLIMQYYLPFIPWMGAILTPFFVCLAVIFFTSRMAYNTEIVAILSSGTSFRRFLRPYMVTAVALGGLLFYANHWLVPHANKSRLTFESIHIHHGKYYGNNIHVRMDSMTFVSLQRFRYHKNTGGTFALEQFESTPTGKKLIYKLTAREILWLEEEGKWRFRDYGVWTIDGLDEGWTTGESMDTLLPLSPDDLEVDVWWKESLDAREMREFLARERAQGSGNLEEYVVEIHRRTATSIAVIILAMIGATIASRKVRGGFGLHLAFGVGLSALYVVFLQFSSTFSIKGGLHPVIGTNIPNVVFGLVTIWLIRKAPK
jgi:lipopolysaccharide export system permease protein